MSLYYCKLLEMSRILNEKVIHFILYNPLSSFVELRFINVITLRLNWRNHYYFTIIYGNSKIIKTLCNGKK